MIGIYSITNIINYKKYIGQSIDIKRRFSDHRWALRHNKHENDHLQKSFNKYGIDCFVFEIICECTKEALDDLERYYIEYYDTKYKNLWIGASHGKFGRYITLEDYLNN